MMDIDATYLPATDLLLSPLSDKLIDLLDTSSKTARLHEPREASELRAIHYHWSRNRTGTST